MSSPRTCEVDGCDRPHSAKGHCAMHHARVLRNGHTDLVRRRNTCSYEGCDNPASGHGFCATHLARYKRHGDPSIVLRRTSSGRATLLNSGYLVVQDKDHPLAGKSGQVLVHRRVLYDALGPGPHPCQECGRPVDWGKPRPDRLEVDHLDGDRTNNLRENLAVTCHRCNGGQAMRRVTECPQGHPYSPENTYVSPNGHRRCRECMRAADRRRRR